MAAIEEAENAWRTVSGIAFTFLVETPRTPIAGGERGRAKTGSPARAGRWVLWAIPSLYGGFCLDLPGAALTHVTQVQFEIFLESRIKLSYSKHT